MRQCTTAQQVIKSVETECTARNFLRLCLNSYQNDVILQEFGFISHSHSCYLNSFQKQMTSVIKRKLSHIKLLARSFIEYVLSYLIVFSRSFFCFDIFFSSNQNEALQQNRDCIEKSILDTIFGSTVQQNFAKFIHITY